MQGADECRRCGTCCVAPDISTLAKPVGVRCPHLTTTGLCSMYDRRPPVCRNYQPDELCHAIEAPTLQERAERYLSLFGIVADVHSTPVDRS